MRINSVHIENFRNFQSGSFSLDANLNILVGDNAMGKTSVIEAIFLCAFGKSFRAIREDEMVKFGEQLTKVKIDFDINSSIIARINNKNKKSFFINDSKIKKTSELLGNINVVLFYPDDLKLIKDGPSERRLFLNREISQISRLYCKNMVDYNRILKQRNKLLLQNKSREECFVFDEILAEIGSQIVLKRIAFINKINEFASKLHLDITNGKEKLLLEYKSSFEFEGKSDIKQKMISKLRENHDQDYRKKTTSIGPHRDDFEISINDIKGRKFGSQGQQRTATLSIKLSEISIIKEYTGKFPIVLLDDVMSELDINRQKSLIYALKDCQVIITTTDTSNLEDEYINKSRIIRLNKN